MNQIIYSKLVSLGYSGALNQMLLRYYRDNGATAGDFNTAEKQYLAVKGFANGALNDQWYAYLRSLGYTGALNDMLVRFWTNLSNDPYAANVVLLMHMDVGSFPDVKGKTVTNTGTTLDTTNFKFGPGSALFNGTAELEIPASADFNFGTGDFTIEAFVRNTVTTSQIIFDFRSADSITDYTVYLDGTDHLAFLDDNGTVTTTNTVTNGSFNHIAVSRTSGVLKLFIQGVEGYTGANITDINANSVLNIGRNAINSFGFTGNMDEIRITKGVGRYTANFTVPSSAFPNS